MAIALLAPGSASTGEFLTRAFTDLLTGLEPVVITDPSGDAERIATRIAAAHAHARAAGDRIALVIGMSVGAHGAAWWASRRPHHTDPPELLVLALPAWTGPPGAAAAGTAAAVDALAQHGVAAELDRLQALYPDDWVVAELARAWTAMPVAELLTSLAGTADSSAPGMADLARIHVPTVVVALRDDPMHPIAVAREWAGAIPAAMLISLGRLEPGRDMAAFGRAVQAGLSRPRAAGGPPGTAAPGPRRPAGPPAPPAAG